jgi:hypothetical protein
MERFRSHDNCGSHGFIYSGYRSSPTHFLPLHHWLGLCAVTVLGALLVLIVEPEARFLNVDPFTVVGGSAFLILLSICIQLSISISGLQRQLHDVNEVVALLHEKVENDPA